MRGYAEMVAARTRHANEVITWVPSAHFLMLLQPESRRHECDRALHSLYVLPLRCYGDDCLLRFASVQAVQAIVVDIALRPTEWLLRCPDCGGRIGPNLEPVV